MNALDKPLLGDVCGRGRYTTLTAATDILR